MSNVRFELKDTADDTGTKVLSLVKITKDESGAEQEETWTTVQELNRLFDACVARWGNNWDLEKLMTCIRECEFD